MPWNPAIPENPRGHSPPLTRLSSDGNRRATTPGRGSELVQNGKGNNTLQIGRGHDAHAKGDFNEMMQHGYYNRSNITGHKNLSAQIGTSNFSQIVKDNATATFTRVYQYGQKLYHDGAECVTDIVHPLSHVRAIQNIPDFIIDHFNWLKETLRGVEKNDDRAHRTK